MIDIQCIGEYAYNKVCHAAFVLLGMLNVLLFVDQSSAANLIPLWNKVKIGIYAL